MKPENNSRTVQLSPDILIREGTHSLYNIKSEVVIEADEIGFSIVINCKEPVSIENLLIIISQKYNVNPEEIRDDVLDFLNQCIGMEFLTEKKVC